MTIISHTHRLIFLRTRKTASTSIEYALIPHLGRRDFIATSTGAEPLDHPWWRTTNRTTPWQQERAAKAWLAAHWTRARRFGIYKHEPAAGVRRAVRPEVWHGYTKVAVERHPYDRVISMWRWRTRGRGDQPSLERFIQFLARQKRSRARWQGRGSKWQLYSNWPIYAIGDQVVADRIIRYEALDTELPKVLAEHGIHGLILGQEKTQHRDPSMTPDALLTGQMRRDIQDLYRREFELMGYEP